MVFFFQYYLNFIRIFCKQTVEILISFAESDLGLHCLHMSRKKKLGINGLRNLKAATFHMVGVFYTK